MPLFIYFFEIFNKSVEYDVFLIILKRAIDDVHRNFLPNINSAEVNPVVEYVLVL